MTGIAGLVHFDGGADIPRRCALMCEALAPYGPHGQSIRECGQAAFGRVLFRLLPEDQFDRQPLPAFGGRSLLVADVRIDNREDVFAALNLGDDGRTSDSELLLRALEHWGEGALDHVVGDFAFALWNSQEQCLTLARDLTGQRPLHYYLGRDYVAFASMPSGLRALPEIEAKLDERQLARFIADVPTADDASYFRHIAKVRPGHLMRITRNGIRSQPYLRVPTQELRFRDERDYFLGLREQFDRATKARLRRAGGTVGAHLSSGMDSSSVAATAARLLQPLNERLIALTSAPRLGFDGPSFPGRISDESRVAAATAALHPNIEHVVVRPSGTSPLERIKDVSSYEEPVGLPCNYVWWAALTEEARERGVSVMLTGEAGNLTISAGGLGILAEFVRRGRPAKWLHEARKVAAQRQASWRGVLATSFGPWVPPVLWSQLHRMRFGRPGENYGHSLLHPRWRPSVAALVRTKARAGRPLGDSPRLRWEHMQSGERGSGRKGVLARWHIDERDPTSDRRVIDFCLRVPAEQMIRDGVMRRLARLAFEDRLPQEALGGIRGYQFADWYEAIHRADLERELAALASDPFAASMVDLDRMKGLVKSWPPGNWIDPVVIGTYRLALLRAFSATNFASSCQ